MSKKVINQLKDKMRESKYADLKPTESSDYRTYKDLNMNFNSEYEFTCDLVINGKAITNDFMGMLNKLCQAAFLVQLNFQSVEKENVKLKHS